MRRDDWKNVLKTFAKMSVLTVGVALIFEASLAVTVGLAIMVPVFILGCIVAYVVIRH